MNTGRRISLLWVGTMMACFFALFGGTVHAFHGGPSGTEPYYGPVCGVTVLFVGSYHVRLDIEADCRTEVETANSRWLGGGSVHVTPFKCDSFPGPPTYQICGVLYDHYGTARGTAGYWLYIVPGHNIIKLSNDTNLPASGDLAEVEPGKVTTTLRAKVYDNNNQPVPNINVKLEVTVEAYSGGHQHNVDRPKGLLSNGVSAGIVVEGNTGNGGMPFTYFAPQPAGDHKIIATCVGQACTQEGPDKVWVGFRGLVPFTPSSSYVLVGFTPSHPANSHNLKPAVSGLVRALANVYRSRFRQDPVLHLNDASLERGGLFDSSAHVGKSWQPPHSTHRKGADIDIRWNPTKHPTTSIPDRNVDKFKKQVSDVGGKAVPAYVGTDNQHFHVEFGG